MAKSREVKMASDSLCLDNIDEFVHDENKIVTCKWLSLTLKIHVNQAKRLLYTFLQQQRKKDKEVNATYFVAGLFKGDNGHLEHRCVVVGEEDLETTRQQLTTVTSCHVYSIQRCCLKDSNSLYTTDYDGVRENMADCNKYSSIHCQRAEVPRRQPCRKTASPDKAVSAQSSEDRSSSSSKAGAQTNGAGPLKAAEAPEPRGSKGKKAEPKGSIATMFAQSSKSKEAGGNKKTDTAPKEAVKESKPAAKKGGVMDFFANAKPAAKPKAPAPTSAAEEETAVSKKGKTGEKKGKAVPEPQRKQSRPAEDSDSDDQPDKKRRRRRIKNDLFDSSEEEMEVEAESPEPSPEREAPPSDPESPEPRQKTPEKRARDPSPQTQQDRPANGTKQRRRRRKQVPKTYLDEDGFMVTEKVWESESTDASEVEDEAKKAAAAGAKTPPKKTQPAPAKKASPQKKKTSPAKGKQTSLTSFFKKK